MDLFDPFEEFLKLNAALREAGVDYALCGGVAMSAHGYIRATEDIDLLIEPDSLPAVRRITAALGYRHSGPELVFKSGVKLVRLIKIFPGSEDYLVLDLILVDDHNRAHWQSRQQLRLPSGTVSVVSKEALIAMKRESNRPLDLIDIERLEKGPDDHGHAT
jgi:hypothetical protein